MDEFDMMMILWKIESCQMKLIFDSWIEDHVLMLLGERIFRSEHFHFFRAKIFRIGLALKSNLQPKFWFLKISCFSFNSMQFR